MVGSEAKARAAGAGASTAGAGAVTTLDGSRRRGCSPGVPAGPGAAGDILGPDGGGSEARPPLRSPGARWAAAGGRVAIRGAAPTRGRTGPGPPGPASPCPSRRVLARGARGPPGPPGPPPPARWAASPSRGPPGAAGAGAARAPAGPGPGPGRRSRPGPGRPAPGAGAPRCAPGEPGLGAAGRALRQVGGRLRVDVETQGLVDPLRQALAGVGAEEPAHGAPPGARTAGPRRGQFIGRNRSSRSRSSARARWSRERTVPTGSSSAAAISS